MNKINALLAERMQKSAPSSKMKALAQQSVEGQLTSFSGIFSRGTLTADDHSFLENLLYTHYETSEGEVEKDLTTLITLTLEVKAIHNQAALLHGQRIKKAHNLLKNYQEGAFTQWLIRAYGNRQTPYNFMLYYEFHESLPESLRSNLDAMPRQAAYTLASRNAPWDKKCNLVLAYSGQTKQQMLEIIRDQFPLEEQDRRKPLIGTKLILQLEKIAKMLSTHNSRIEKKDRKTMKALLKNILDRVSIEKTK